MNDLSERGLDDLEEIYIPYDEKKTPKKFRRWTQQENRRYIGFLSLNRADFLSEYLRRKSKVFKRLADAVKTKNQSQCKSHHQKMISKYANNFEQVIASISGLLKPDEQSLDFTELSEKKISNVTSGLSPGIEQIIFSSFDQKKQEKNIFDVLSMVDQ